MTKRLKLAVAFLLMVGQREGKELPACTTVDGLECKFPFTFDNVIHTGCTNHYKAKYDSPSTTGDFIWCPTIENWSRDSLYTLARHYYGECSDTCRGVSKFPSELYVSSGVSASKYPDMEGKYEITFDSYNGKPVYKHESKFLFLNSYNNWAIRYGEIDPKLAHAYAETTELNIPVTGWKYWNDEEWIEDPEMKVEVFVSDL